jgi:tungstate transport system ATP-binding protein
VHYWQCGASHCVLPMLDPSASPPHHKRLLNGGRALLPLELRGLTYETGGKRVIDRMDARIEVPGITVIMGPNGAGKSVLLKLLHGLISPTGGEVLWAGRRLDRELARRQAMVFQRPVLLRRSTAGNIWHALGLRGVHRKERSTRVVEALRLAGLERRAETPARTLSGGEQQRLCLARALSLEPEVLFLDEPTASLDPTSTLLIERLLIEAQRFGIKIIIVTHDVGQARRLAQEVIFLHHGRVIEHGTARGFFDHPHSAAARAFVAGDLVL